MENNWRQRKLLNVYYGKNKQLRSAKEHRKAAPAAINWNTRKESLIMIKIKFAHLTLT